MSFSPSLLAFSYSRAKFSIIKLQFLSRSKRKSSSSLKSSHLVCHSNFSLSRFNERIESDEMYFISRAMSSHRPGRYESISTHIIHVERKQKMRNIHELLLQLLRIII